MPSDNSKFQRLTIVALLAIFMLINFADKAVLGLVGVPLMRELSLTTKQFGLLGGSFFFLFALSGISFGFLSTRVRCKSILSLLIVTWSIAQIPIGLGVATLELLLASRILLGIGEGPAYPLALYACYKWFPNEKRSLPTAIIMQGAQVGMLVAGPLVTAMTAHFGWRSSFLMLGIVGMMWLVAWHLLTKEGTVDTESRGEVLAQSKVKISYARLILEPTFIGNVLMCWVGFWVLSLVFTWVPSFLQTVLLYTPSQTGWVFAGFVAVTIPIVLTASYFSYQMQARGIISRIARAIPVACCTVAGAALIFGSVYWDMGRLARTAMLAIGCSLPQVSFALCTTIVAEVSPPAQRGAALSLTNSIASTGGLLAPIMMGIFLQRFPGTSGYVGGFLSTSLIVCIGGGIALLTINPARTLARTGLLTKPNL